MVDALDRAWRDPRGRAGALMLAVMAAVAAVGPTLLPDPLAQPCVLTCRNLAPSLAHPFGTDDLSRDILSRVANGGRISLAVAILAVSLSVTLGAAIGLVAGYSGGAVDAALMRLVDAALAIPRLFLLLLVLAVWEQVPIAVLILLIGATGWFGTGRLVRGEALRLREESYVRAAEALGASRRRIIFRHLLPNTAGPLLVVPLPTASWGGMIFDAKSVLVAAPWAGIFPGLAIVITVLSANLFGDALRDAVDPRGA
jgi:peptide/nickel transport system permease protein